jgi:hypothetical protein
MTQAQVLRAAVVEAPSPAAHTGNLLDVADVHDGLTWIDPNDMFTSWNCVDVNAVDVCAADTTPTKTFTAPTLVDGVRFAVYLGGACKPLSADTEANIDRVFDLRESRGVEKQFETRVLGPLGTTVSGSPVSAAHALALMENALGDQYAGIGTVHMSPLLATLLLQDQLLVEVGGKFYTKLGTKVVVGTGYTSANLYGTGDVTIYRSQQDTVDAPDTANNTINVLAERAYVVVSDCVLLKMVGIPGPTAGGTSSPGGDDPGPAVDLTTGTDTVTGPGGTWTPPSGNLRGVSVIVTSGSVEVDGDEVTAPNTVTFDADTGETLDPPDVTASSPNDRAVVSWVTAS